MAAEDGVVSQDNRGIIIGLAATLLLHLALLLVVPPTFLSPSGTGHRREGDSFREYDIALLPDEEQPEQKMARFVETNPEAPANPPDETENFAAQDQQAAQPEPDRENADMPSTKGEQEKSDRIVVGRLEDPVPNVAATPPEQQLDQPAEPEEPASSRLKVPLPGFEKVEGEAEEGIGASPSQETRPSDNSPLFVAGDVEASADGKMPRLVPVPARPSPQPRPRLKQVRPGILQERPVGVSNAGIIGVDARFSEFGDYLQELIETVQVQWDRILINSQVYPPSETRVAIRFSLNSQGEVQILEVVEKGASQPAIYACLNAITARQPYRPWTKQMVEVLGTEEQITFDFLYR